MSMSFELLFANKSTTTKMSAGIMIKVFERLKQRCDGTAVVAQAEDEAVRRVIGSECS